MVLFEATRTKTTHTAMRTWQFFNSDKPRFTYLLENKLRDPITALY